MSEVKVNWYCIVICNT